MVTKSSCTATLCGLPSRFVSRVVTLQHTVTRFRKSSPYLAFLVESKWQADVLKSFQDMFLEADKHRQSAVTDARISMDEVELLSTRIRALERAKEDALQDRDALAARLAFCEARADKEKACLLYTSPSPRDRQKSRMPSSA